MPRKRSQLRAASGSANGLQQYVKLEKRLLLLAWLNELFGYENNRDLLSDIKGAGEGFDAGGRSDVCKRLESRGSDKLRIRRDDLFRYDDNIREHLEAMNARRPEPITLRYFQHLAVLYTEIFLDHYFNRRGKLLQSLNGFVDKRNASKNAGEPKDAKFSEADLKKLAFWMATGSGKTLIMHINYRQFLRYNDLPLDNILLITPNEGLSEQHIEEMTASNIPCLKFDLNESGLSLAHPDTVRVIEITKLVEEKRGGGQSVPVEAFEGNNLIFVDEGHKGSGGEAWRSFRDALGQTGFTFEYSATFGQALTAARNDELTAEYGKAIIFDYSYRYFHGDGYGKDFRILNLKEETTEDKTETLLLGNMLSFYEQQRVFEEGGEELRPYNLEKPLWVFVGSSVNAVYTENKRKRSDVLTVARFLHHLLENKRGWAVKAIRKLLDGKSGVVSDRRDIFAEKFQYLRDARVDADTAYQELLAKVLHTPTGGGLHLCDLRGSTGELGLKASGAEEYFGLIYIGDTTSFKKLVEADDSGITLEEDAISDSLFEGINEPETTVEILIGAKKFMEGWNSWRVSNMGLLNIGRHEGSQIIQLFGRGVRLRGKEFSLKRSTAQSGTHPEHVRLLETLNIFAVRADYMGQFRGYLEREGVETEAPVELPLFTWANDQFLQKGLVVPRVPEDREFASEATIVLEPDCAARVHVDMSMKVQAMESTDGGFAVAEASGGRAQPIPQESLGLVDWERVYLDLLEYKQQRGLTNLAIPRGAPKNIITTTHPDRLYTLVVDDGVVRPSSFAGREVLQEVVTNVLRRYTDNFYRVRREKWESDRMVYQTVDKSDPNLSFNQTAVRERKAGYVVKVPRSKQDLVTSIQKLAKDADSLYWKETRELPRIHFDRHLYQPLLVEQPDGVETSPPALNQSETRFVSDLKTYWAKEKDATLAGYDVFLLRNLGEGSGIGFFEESWFYPDFILWIVNGARQHVVFIEPHGMVYAASYRSDPKARLHERLADLEKEIAARSQTDKEILLDSYILSATAYSDLRTKYGEPWGKEKFAERHILFLEERSSEYDYVQRIFEEQLGRSVVLGRRKGVRPR